MPVAVVEVGVVEVAVPLVGVVDGVVGVAAEVVRSKVLVAEEEGAGGEGEEGEGVE